MLPSSTWTYSSPECRTRSPNSLSDVARMRVNTGIMRFRLSSVHKYMAAGQLIEEVSGETWEQYVKKHVFAPLGMNHSTDSIDDYLANPNHARPHSRSGGAIQGLGKQTPLNNDATISQNAAPAGGLAISANEDRK